MTRKTATIVGINGGFGRLFAEKLAASGYSLGGVDLDPRPARPELLQEYHPMEMGRPTGELPGCFRGADLILLCTPAAPTFRWVEYLGSRLGEETLCLDILSVKEAITAHAAALGFAGEYLSLHPMFKPAAGLAGRTVAAVPVQAGPRAQAFLALLESWEVQVVTLDAQRHDQTTAIVQAAVHAALLAVGRAAYRGAVEPALVEALATPVSGPFFAALERVLEGDPATYQAIQEENRHAAIARSEMLNVLRELGREGGLKDIFRELR